MSSAHLSPDPHRLPDPSSTRPRRVPGSGSKVLVYLLFALALVATVVMFFADSDVWLNIAVIAALWAAFIGAVLVSRYSGALGEEATRAEERDARHLAELDAERADHRRREAELESGLPADGSHRDETLESIRTELAALRAQLSELSGLDFSEDQVAVRARAERIIELERRSEAASASSSGTTSTSPRGASTSGASSSTGSAPSTGTRGSGSRGARGNHSEPEARQGGRRGGFATGTFSAVSWTGTDSEETSMIPLVVDTRESDAAGTSATTETPAAPTPTTPEPAARDPRRPATGSFSAHTDPASSRWPVQDAVASSPAPAGDGDPGHHRRRAQSAPDPHGRRRADEKTDATGSVTVAELMAQLKKNTK